MADATGHIADQAAWARALSAASAHLARGGRCSRALAALKPIEAVSRA